MLVYMTKLIYLEQMDQYACAGQVVDVQLDGDWVVVILDQTIFYPQGGGQPYDTGVITSSDGRKFLVEEVRFVDGVVRHIGKFDDDAFEVGDSVTCAVDVPRRQLHARLHSAGHVVDMALKRLGVPWVPGKGYHFPDGPYVEYAGDLSSFDKEKLRGDLESMCNQILGEGIATKVLFMNREEMLSMCAFVPEQLPANKPGRVVMYGDFGVPCGGTHVAKFADIGRLVIRKMKQEREHVKVSYAVA